MLFFFLIFFRNVRPFQKFWEYRTRQPPSILSFFSSPIWLKGRRTSQPPTDDVDRCPIIRGLLPYLMCVGSIVTGKKRLDAGRRRTPITSALFPLFLSPLYLPSRKENRRWKVAPSSTKHKQKRKYSRQTYRGVRAIIEYKEKSGEGDRNGRPWRITSTSKLFMQRWNK